MAFNLQSLHILEKIKSDDWMLVWSYPEIEENSQTIFKRKCIVAEKHSLQNKFQYFHLNNWVYLYFSQPDEGQAKQNIILLCTTDFNTAKYEKFCRILSFQYCKSRNPKLLLQTFISALTKGQCLNENGETFFLKEFENSISWKYQLIDVISRFGLETILIYMALLMKKRVAVYHHDLMALKEFMIRLPAFVIHRDFNDSVYPWVDDQKDELDSFKDSKFHIAGFTTSTIENHAELYDLYVNVPASEISVAQHSKDILAMTKHHKNIAVFMVQLLEKKGLTERDIVYEISQKTKELIGNLRQYCSKKDGEYVILISELKKKNLTPIMETFILNLARAENLRIISN